MLDFTAEALGAICKTFGKNTFLTTNEDSRGIEFNVAFGMKRD
jgi:hypothetical protein